MSRWDDIIIEQMQADALAHMGEAEWREMCGRKKDKDGENIS